MKKGMTLAIICLLCGILATGCQKTGSKAWENVKTAGRFMNKSIDSAFGKDYESRLVNNEEDFTGPVEGEFIPLNDKDLKSQYATDGAFRQAKLTPGAPGSGLPSLKNFQEPKGALSEMFQKIYFETDNYSVQAREDKEALKAIGAYLKKHPNVFVCIEGHCDERASAAYNMALGTKRANNVRGLLIKAGADLNQIFPISYGKEKPVALGHGEEAWRQNRRVEFKIFQK